MSPRTVSDLERGLATTPHKDTVRLLADALQLGGQARVEFEVAARGHAAPGRVGTGAGGGDPTLPRDIASFTGRQHELAGLTDAVGGAGGVVSIHAIGGMAGIGKTAFAVHAAHQLAGRFPAGQIFCHLHAHTPGQQPVDPADALASLLLTIGVPAGQIPADLAGAGRAVAGPGGRAAAAAGPGRRGQQRADPAAAARHRRQPRSGHQPAALTALEDAADDQPGRPARRGGGRAAGPARRPARPQPCRPGGQRRSSGCAGACRWRSGWRPASCTTIRPGPLAGLAAELAAATGRLELLATENLSVAAALDLSYADLAPDQQRLFRRLGLHPGTDIDRVRRRRSGWHRPGRRPPRPGGALRALPARRAGPGRYRMHDLIREHARTLAARLDPGADREQATGRLLDYYQHAAARAEALLARQPRRPAPPAGTGRPRPRSWPTGNRRWRGPGPSGPACWPAWTRPPRPASMPGSSR